MTRYAMNQSIPSFTPSITSKKKLPQVPPIPMRRPRRQQKRPPPTPTRTFPEDENMYSFDADALSAPDVTTGGGTTDAIGGGPGVGSGGGGGINLDPSKWTDKDWARYQKGAGQVTQALTDPNYGTQKVDHSKIGVAPAADPRQAAMLAEMQKRNTADAAARAEPMEIAPVEMMTLSDDDLLAQLAEALSPDDLSLVLGLGPEAQQADMANMEHWRERDRNLAQELDDRDQKRRALAALVYMNGGA